MVRAWRWNGPCGASGTRESAMLTPVTPHHEGATRRRESQWSLTIGIRDHGCHRRMVEGSCWCHRHRHCVVRAWRWNGPCGASGTRESTMLTPVTPPRRCDPPTRESVSLTIGIRDHGCHRRIVEGSCWCHRHRYCVVRAWRWNGPFGASGTRESAMLTPVTPPRRCGLTTRESVSLTIGSIRDHGCQRGIRLGHEEHVKARC